MKPPYLPLKERFLHGSDVGLAVQRRRFLLGVRSLLAAHFVGVYSTIECKHAVEPKERLFALTEAQRLQYVGREVLQAQDATAQQ